MKEPRQVLWWGLSIIALLVGAGMAGVAGLRGSGSPQFASLSLLGLYLAVAGAVSLQARVQMARAEATAIGRHRRRADLALLMAGAPLLAVGLWGGQADLRAHMRAPAVVVGQVESLYSYSSRRNKGVRIRLEGREAPLRWTCGWFTCGPRERIMAVPQGASVQLAVIGDKAVGLKVGASEVLDLEFEQRRLLMTDATFLGAALLFTILALVYAWRWTFGWRRTDRRAERLALEAFRGGEWPGLDKRKP